MSDDDDDFSDDKPEIDQSTAFDPTSWHGRTMQQVLSAPRGMPVQDSEELQRILQLPRRPVVQADTPTAEALIELQMRKYSLGPRACACATIDEKVRRGDRECIQRFSWIQAWMLHEITVANGLISNVAVGAGKTTLNFLGPLAFRDCRLALLLIPANLVEQIETDYLLHAQHFRVPALVVHKGEKKTRAYNPPINPHTGMPETVTVHVLPYTGLSSTKKSAWISHLRPDVIVADECFPGDTLITTDEGDLPIRDVVELGRGTRALSYDKEGRETWKRIVGRMRRAGNKPLVRVTHEQGSFVCTEDHKIWTEGSGYIHAKALVKDHTLRMRVVWSELQAETAEQGLLFEDVRVDSTFRGGSPTTQAEPRRNAGASGSCVSGMREDLQRTRLSTHQPLQCEVLEATSAPQARDMLDVRDRVHSSEGGTRTLRQALCAELPRAQTSPTHRSEGEEGLCGLLGGLSHEVTGQDHGSALLAPVCRGGEQSAVQRSEAAGDFAAPEGEPVWVQQKRGDTQGGESEDEGSNLSLPRREQSAHGTTTQAVSGAGSALRCDGVDHPDASGARSIRVPAEPLQRRHRHPGDTSRDRGGREQPQVEEVAVPRQAEDRGSELSRVVRVEVLEQGGSGGPAQGGECGPVYDLTIEDTHCYYADGVLVSNCDALKDMEATRTMRLLRYFDENRTTRFAGWTGSLTDSSIKEMAHLSALALRRTLSPLPVEREVIDEWSRCLDAVPNPCPPGALTQLLAHGEGIHQVRRAFHRRLAETPGFILIGGRRTVITPSGAEVTIDIREKVAPKLPDIVNEALARVRANLRPDTLVGGEEDEILVDPLEKAKCAREVATGLIYRWEFPPIQGVPQRRETITEWYRARKAWHQELRQKMLRGEQHLDSASLCENAAKRAWGDSPNTNVLPEWRSEHWPHWRDVMDTVKYVPKAHRLHSFLVEDAIRWGLESPGIIWYSMSEFALWAVDIARSWGIDLPMYGEGSGTEIVKETGNRSILASIKSHARGRNGLQFSFHRQSIINTLASARMWTQLFGRLKRRGQKHEKILTDVYKHTDELASTFMQALRRGRYVKAVTDEDQELLLGWDGDLPDDED